MRQRQGLPVAYIPLGGNLHRQFRTAVVAGQSRPGPFCTTAAILRVSPSCPWKSGAQRHRYPLLASLPGSPRGCNTEPAEDLAGKPRSFEHLNSVQTRCSTRFASRTGSRHRPWAPRPRQRKLVGPTQSASSLQATSSDGVPRRHPRARARCVRNSSKQDEESKARVRFSGFCVWPSQGATLCDRSPGENGAIALAAPQSRAPPRAFRLRAEHQRRT